MAATALPQPLWLFPTLNTTTMRKELPEEKLASIRRAFTTFDSGTKGYLDREDLRMAMTALLGYRPSKSELHTLAAENGKKSSCGVNLQTFVQIMSLKLSTRDPDDELRQKFMALDTHYRGYLTLEDVLLAFKPFAADTEKAFVQADSDRDGKVSYKDFERMMKYP